VTSKAAINANIRIVVMSISLKGDRSLCRVQCRPPSQRRCFITARGISTGTRSLTLIYAPTNGSSLPLLLGPRFEPRVEEEDCGQAVIINMGFTWLEFLMSKVSTHCSV